jgi:hypothetical protein
MIGIPEAEVRHIANLQQRQIVQKHTGLELCFSRLGNPLAIFPNCAKET